MSLENLLLLSYKHMVTIPGWPEMVASLLNTKSVPLRIRSPMKTAVLPLRGRKRNQNALQRTNPRNFLSHQDSSTDKLQIVLKKGPVKADIWLLQGRRRCLTTLLAELRRKKGTCSSRSTGFNFPPKRLTFSH